MINILKREFELKVKEQNFKVPENLFHPYLYQKNNDVIDKKCIDSINKSDFDIRKE